MKVPRKSEALITLAAGLVSKWLFSNRKLEKQVSTAAAPTRLWKRATICGKSVTSIRLAAMVPMRPPVVMRE